MKIVSWNCRNGLNEIKAKKIYEAFSDADIFVIQECRRTDIDAFKCDWKFKNWYGDDQEYSDLGIAVFSKEFKIGFSDEFNRKFRYVVPYIVSKGEKFLTLFAVWTKPVPQYYDKNVVQAIEYYKTKEFLKGNVIIIGDFNTGYNENTKETEKYYSDLLENLKDFKNSSLGKPEEFITTFYHNRGNKEYLNDFCFVSENLFAGVKFHVHNKWEVNDYGQKRWNGSDHCPISLEFDF
ncbi:MAG: endonuclease/exonuclease/phosphatase family protein [Treponema sp.]|jgi:exonuclease III|nr:endonuclease/exonuclease/phosphatase family protein [Treponema sp.]